jgi:pimeloyl-ACP methyl ester carboxylesterase
MFSEDQFVDVPGGQVYVKRWVPDDCRTSIPLVLLHDSLGCVDAWREFPRQLAEHVSRPVIAYDRLGFGHSTARQEVPSLRFIEEESEIFFPAICKGLNLDSFALFDYSVGGEMAVVIAGEMGERCEKLVVVSAQGFVEERTVQGIHQAQERFADPEQLARLARWHGDKTAWTLRAWWEVWLSPDFATWSLAPYLPPVRCPVLAIHGDQDDYGSLAVPEMICRLAGGPCEMQILEGCGHMPQRERPEEVFRLVTKFLAHKGPC